MTADGHVVSVVITNHNYGAFLAEAIESALGQTHPTTEVVVVDDGSTDDSRHVIGRYHGRVARVILAEQRGQTAAANRGFLACTGELVIFLDADDRLSPTAAAEAAAVAAGGAAKVHWPLLEIDADGRPSGRVVPRHRLPAGDLKAAVVADGPGAAPFPPTSGNAWSRDFLRRVLPMPADELPFWLDAYLSALAPLFGPVARIDEPQGCYRAHAASNFSAAAFERRLELAVAHDEVTRRDLAGWCARMGIEADIARWEERSWFHRIRLSLTEIRRVLPPGARYLLLDEDQWATGGTGEPAPVPFPDRGGQYGGKPSDDAAAIVELERAREEWGATYAVVAWPAFWWLDHYAGFHRHLRSTATCLLENDRLVVFDLTTPPAGTRR